MGTLIELDVLPRLDTCSSSLRLLPGPPRVSWDEGQLGVQPVAPPHPPHLRLPNFPSPDPLWALTQLTQAPKMGFCSGGCVDTIAEPCKEGLNLEETPERISGKLPMATILRICKPARKLSGSADQHGSWGWREGATLNAGPGRSGPQSGALRGAVPGRASAAAGSDTAR